MLHRRGFLALAVGAALLVQPAFAFDRVGYTPEAFEAAQAAGRSILVEVHATWCPTCKAQTAILSKLEKDPRYVNLLLVHVDFDSQKDAVRKFGARMQSTLVTFKGAKETGRSVGDTDKTSLIALLDKAV